MSKSIIRNCHDCLGMSKYSLNTVVTVLACQGLFLKTVTAVLACQCLFMKTVTAVLACQDAILKTVKIVKHVKVYYYWKLLQLSWLAKI
jgi:hypothetical protein